MRGQRHPARRLLTLGLLLLASCMNLNVRRDRKVAEPIGRQFFAAPQRYQGERVRISGLRATRVDITRPIVFERLEQESDRLVVTDGRSLATQEHLRLGEVVTVVIDCSEGSPERGNLLLAIERPFR